jgi:hypothetical protein
MPTVIKIDDQYAVEESTANEAGEAAVPTSINWTLTDADGTVINSRTAVSVAVPAASIDIALTGDDLAIQAGETGDAVNRIFTVEAVYNSDLGSDLTLKDSLKFPLVNLVAV